MSIEKALKGVVDLMVVGAEIYAAITRVMDSINHAPITGSSKKAWVLAYAKTLVIEAGKNWDKWASYISDFIDSAKSIYNAVKGAI